MTAHTSDRLAFLRTIVAEPDEDHHRLVYADWLDEQDKVPCERCTGGYEKYCLVCDGTGRIGVDLGRAELIRVQCELAKWKGKDEEHCPTCGEHWKYRVGAGYSEWSDCRNDHRWASITRLDMVRRELDILTRHGERWRAGPVCEKCRGKGKIPEGVPYGSHYQCPDCWGGDAGGLKRRFDYPNGTRTGEGTTVNRELVRVEYDRGFAVRLIVPRLTDLAGRLIEQCPDCQQLNRRRGAGGATERRCGKCDGGTITRHAPSPWFRTVLTATPERGLIREVVPIDSEPYPDLSLTLGVSRTFDWHSVIPPDGTESAVIPRPIFDLMKRERPDNITPMSGGGEALENLSRDPAITTLGRALAAFGRNP